MKAALGFGTEADGWIYNEGVRLEKVKSKITDEITKYLAYSKDRKTRRGLLQGNVSEHRLRHAAAINDITEQSKLPSYGKNVQSQLRRFQR